MIILIFILTAVPISFITSAIIDRIVDKEIERERKERDDIEDRLTASLKNLCAQLGIDLSYHNELGASVGRIMYYKDIGRLSVDNARIEILKEHENEPYTLAHELGHYMAIKQRQDDSEQGANVEADKLCRVILNQREQDILSIALYCHFSNFILDWRR